MRRRRWPVAGAGGRTAEHRFPMPSGRTRRGESGSPAAGVIPGREQTSSNPSNEFPATAVGSPAGANRFLGRATRSTPELRLVARRRIRSVHRPQFSIDHSVLPLKHHAAAPHCARVRPLLVGPAHARIFIEHSMFRPQHQESVRRIAQRSRSRVQALAHVMHLMPRDRVISPCEARSFEVHHDAGGVAPRDTGPSGCAHA